MEIKIRTAKVEDAEKLLDIYSYYVKKTAVTFEYEVPSVEEFQERIRHISSHYPYLIAEEEGEIIGYSYADRLRPRAAFGWDVEMTIYLNTICLYMWRDFPHRISLPLPKRTKKWNRDRSNSFSWTVLERASLTKQLQMKSFLWESMRSAGNAL